MKRTIGAIVTVSFLAVGGQALASDPPSKDSHSDQAMKDCMAKQKATNSSMTQEAMETVCMNEAKHKDKDGNDLATGTQAPAQH
jgi:pentapeptide MXKDX repeat protein